MWLCGAWLCGAWLIAGDSIAASPDPVSGAVGQTLRQSRT